MISVKVEEETWVGTPTSVATLLFECKYRRSIVDRRRFSTAFHCSEKFIGHFSLFRLFHSRFFPYLFPGVKRGDLGEMRDSTKRSRRQRERVVKLLRSIVKLIRVYGMRPADERRWKNSRDMKTWIREEIAKETEKSKIQSSNHPTCLMYLEQKISKYSRIFGLFNVF